MMIITYILQGDFHGFLAQFSKFYLHSNMKNKNFIALSASGDSAHGSEDNDQPYSHDCHSEVDPQPTGSGFKEDETNNKYTGHAADTEYEEGQCTPEENVEENLVGSDSDMEIEDINNLHALRNSYSEIEPNGSHYSDHELGRADFHSTSVVKETKISNESQMRNNNDGQYANNQCVPEDIINKDLACNSTFLEKCVKLKETFTVEEDKNTRVHAENRCLAVRDGNVIGMHKINGYSITGVKRARTAMDEQQPSVQVTYKFLTRASKFKLEELLQQWSEWHAQHSSSEGANEVLESGEETFFPALHVGLGKISAVSFWMDNQSRKQQNNELIPLYINSVPLYDRGCALGLTSDGGSSNVEGGLEIVDAAARCFNCGSYSHSLKECPRPRDNIAVSKARKHHKSNHKQNSGSHNPTRYYQSSPAGKYDGLLPGALDAETRHLLDLRELDPPPWLNRMREIGYPPGYQDPDADDGPSGITIFDDEEIKQQEDGEIIETDHEPRRKMTVEFPGINAPIPENADERLWEAGPSYSDFSRDRLHHKMNRSSETASRRYHRDHRWSRDYRDDGPPGVDPGVSPYSSSYTPRYGSHDSSNKPYSTRSTSHRSHQTDEDFSNGGSCNYSPYSHDASHSPRDYSSSRYENRR